MPLLPRPPVLPPPLDPQFPLQLYMAHCLVPERILADAASLSLGHPLPTQRPSSNERPETAKQQGHNLVSWGRGRAAMASSLQPSLSWWTALPTLTSWAVAVRTVGGEEEHRPALSLLLLPSSLLLVLVGAALGLVSK